VRPASPPSLLVALAVVVSTAAAAQPDASAPPDSVAAAVGDASAVEVLREAVVWSPAPGVVVVARDSAALATLLEPAEAERPVERGAFVGTGVASFYGERFRGRRTASGERFNPDGLTCAHRTLPFGTRLRVTSLRTGRSVVVRVTDRGPFHGGRVIDLSRAAARQIGMVGAGTGRVRIERL